MSNISFDEWDVIVNSGVAVQTIAPTVAIFVQTGGIVQVAGDNLVMVNLGSIAAGVKLDLEVHQVGTLNAATLIALR